MFKGCRKNSNIKNRSKKLEVLLDDWIKIFVSIIKLYLKIRLPKVLCTSVWARQISRGRGGKNAGIVAGRRKLARRCKITLSLFGNWKCHLWFYWIRKEASYLIFDRSFLNIEIYFFALCITSSNMKLPSSISFINVRMDRGVELCSYFYYVDFSNNMFDNK